VTSDGGAPTPPQRPRRFGARRLRAGWVRAATDRVPTRWFAGIGTALFLAATAAFGGLAAVAEPGPTTLEAGVEHRSDEFAITVERAVLLDEFPEAGVFVDEDENERVLAVQIGIENLWTEPLQAGPLTLTKSLAVEELGESPMESVARFDDATISPWLQPGVPAEIVLTWIFEEGDLVDGDILHLTLSDLSLYTGSFVTTGQSWEDPVPAATLTLVVTDAGSGS
jgi:hypothetical protein